jgi:hypothetical protein
VRTVGQTGGILHSCVVGSFYVAKLVYPIQISCSDACDRWAINKELRQRLAVMNQESGTETRGTVSSFGSRRFHTVFRSLLVCARTQDLSK